MVVLIPHTWKCHETETGEMVKSKKGVAQPERLRALGSLQSCPFPTVISFLTIGLQSVSAGSGIMVGRAQWNREDHVMAARS